MLKKNLIAAVAAGITAVFALSACASVETGGSTEPADSGVTNVTEGKLTIATGEPAYSPWVLNDAPESGEGFEAAVAYAVAEKMGYEKEDVVWVRTSFEGVIAPGPKDFDLNIQQFSATPERAEVVDFSTPYYETTQAVVAVPGSDAAKAKSIADLKNAVIGVAAGSTSLTAAETLIDPADLQVFNNNDDVVAALQNGLIDAMVTDLPGAFYVRDAQLEGDGVIVGQITAPESDEFAFLLPKGSALTAEVSAAVDALRADGTLDALVQTWLADQADAPFLQ